MDLKHNRTFITTLHLLGWGVLFCLPFMLSSGQAIPMRTVFQHSWLPLMYSVIIFYSNYLWFIDALLFRKKSGQFFALNMVLIALFVWFHLEISKILALRDIPSANAGPPWKLVVFVHTISLTIPLIFSITLKLYQRWIKSEAERIEAANAKLQSELQHLKYQLQPHFFFNSLNNIYSLVDISPEQAKVTIHSLAKLMRYMLYETTDDLVSLAREVDFMKKYIELMEIRTPDKTTVRTEFPEIPEDIRIAPLLYIALIENAFKHGVSGNTPCEIQFLMSLDGQQVRFETRNQFRPKISGDRSKSGIGLANLQKRLTLLYPDKHIFSAGVKGDQFETSLTIDLPEQLTAHRSLPKKEPL